MKIPKGSLLFHGTGEPFAAQPITELRPGGDAMFWTTRDSVMAQTYIPEAGSTICFQLRSLLSPQLNAGISSLHHFQLEHGLEFSDVEWKGNQLQSYRLKRVPRPARLNYTDYAEQEHNDQALLATFRDTLESWGYSPTYADSSPGYTTWLVKQEMRKTGDNTVWLLKPRDWFLPGKLIVLRTTRELALADIATGKESSLLDPDHLRHRLFNRIASDNCRDGVLINDHAQLGMDHDNFGHQAIGLTAKTLAGVVIETVIDAIHPQNFYKTHYHPGCFDSPEWTAYLWRTNRHAA